MPPDRTATGPQPAKRANKRAPLRAVPTADPLLIEDLGGTDEYIRMMVFGDPGVGKTVLAGSSAACWILDGGRGTASARIQGSKAKRTTLRDWDDMNNAYEYLRHEEHGFQWVWLDDISLFQERGLDHIMTDLVAERPHRKLYLPDRGEYGQNMNRLSLWVRTMSDLPVNFGITAHTHRFEDDDGSVTVMPWIQGRNMPEKICGYMDIVGYLSVRVKDEKAERILLVQKDGKHYVKDRYGVLGNRLLNPTIPAIEATIRRSLNGGAKVGAQGAVKRATQPARKRA